MRPSNRSCPSFETLSRGVSEPLSRRVAAHLDGCLACRRTRDALVELDEAARLLPITVPDPLLARRMEEALVAIAPAQVAERGSRTRLLAWGAAIAAGIALAIAIVPSSGRDPLHRFEASANARFERVTRHATGDSDSTLELVRLEEGTVALQVEHLGPKERVVVATADAEVEVRGTRFEVDAEGGRLRGVAVHEGKVEVRVAGRGPVLLLSGDRWTRDDTALRALEVSDAASNSRPPREDAVVAEASTGPLGASTDSPRASGASLDAIAASKDGARASGDPAGGLLPIGAPGARRSHRSTSKAAAPSPLDPPGLAAAASSPLDPPALAVTAPAPPEPKSPDAPTFPAEEAFASGWAALRDGAPLDAARHFSIAAAGEAGDLAGDAAYWELVSLARAGDAAAAESRMVRFLERNRSSQRAGEVALMLGLRLAARGDRQGAVPHLHTAAGDPNDDVRERARQALDRLGVSDDSGT